MNDQPAFPQTIDDMGTMRSVTQGMNLRCYIATACLQGLLSNSVYLSPPSALCKLAVNNADELLKQLGEKE